MASLYPDAPIISFSSLSKAYLAPGWRAGWMAVGRTDRLDDRAGRREEAGGRPPLLDRARWSTRFPPRSTAIARTKRASAPRCASAPTLTVVASQRDRRHPHRRADGGVLRDAARCRCRRASPTRTTSSGCCARPASCASTDPASARSPRTDSSASSSSPIPRELSDIYDLVGDFTRDFLVARQPALSERSESKG